MKQRFVAAVWAGEKYERQWAIEFWFDDEIPSEKVMTEQERSVFALERLIESIKSGQEVYIREQDEDNHAVSWEQSAEDTEKGFKK